MNEEIKKIIVSILLQKNIQFNCSEHGIMLYNTTNVITLFWELGKLLIPIESLAIIRKNELCDSVIVGSIYRIY